MRLTVVIVLLVLACGVASAQTETPTPTPSETPTPTSTPTPEPYVYATVAPEVTDEPGQMTRFDYVATAGDVQIANLLTWLLYSFWAQFLFLVIVALRGRK
jgi:hypothetical protein